MCPASSSGLLRPAVGMSELTDLSSVLQAECKGRLFTKEETIFNLDKWDTMAVTGRSSGGSCMAICTQCKV